VLALIRHRCIIGIVVIGCQKQRRVPMTSRFWRIARLFHVDMNTILLSVDHIQLPPYFHTAVL